MKWVKKEELIPNNEQIEAAGSELLAKLLLQRGVSSVDKIKQFLNPTTIQPVSPYSYNDMEKAVLRIKKAIEAQEKILIYGDFDADGVTSTALMHKTLTHLGANVLHYIPDRQTENHGLNKSILLTKISKEKVKLIITVDCGISNSSEVALVKTFGVDVIVTDHHEAKDELPNACAILDAKAQGALKDELSFEDINSLTMMAGVGAAFKLACALLTEYDKIDFIQELLPLVAVGTIADVMPLMGENRLFVTLGMDLISQGKNKGLTELLSIAGVNLNQPLTSGKVAFMIAPRINAVGRLDNAETAFKLLVSDNDAEISMCAQSMDDLNKLRQELSEKTYIEALEYIEKNHKDTDSVVIAYDKDWHIGIVGIVASRIMEKFNKPVFMFTDSPDGEMLRASVRSTSNVNIFEALDVNSELFDSFGGHATAAGLSLDKKKVSLEQFKEQINRTVFEITGGELAEPTLNIDLEVKLSDLSLSLLEDLNKLEPCGEGNPAPVFISNELKLMSERTMGANNNHLKFSCLDKYGCTVDCVYWKHSSLNIPLQSELDIAFVPQINEFNGVKYLQLEICDYHSENIALIQNCSMKFLDHRNKTDIFEQVIDYVKTSQKDIKIFVEDKEIEKLINSALGDNEVILNRKNLTQAQQLMFFDYPPNKTLLKRIMKETLPQIVHVMNYKDKKYDIDEFVGKISGMLKFAANKYAGIVSLEDISSALAVSDELTILLIKLLNSTGVVKVNSFEQGELTFEFQKPVGIDVIKENEIYEQCRMELFKIKNFREEICNCCDIKQFFNIL